MFRFNLLLFSILGATCALKVMNFNLWQQGQNVNNGLNKIADEIKAVNPDIVAVQETTGWMANKEDMHPLMKLLGNGWSGMFGCEGNQGVITRHEILGLYDRTRYGMNTRVRLNDSGIEISVWSLGLQYRMFGPYEAATNGKATTREKILYGDLKEEGPDQGRIYNMIELIKHREFVQQIKNSDKVPVIVAGGFWSPSHLDWTEGTKNNHYGWVIDWPVTKLLSQAAGMTDSYREVHPDPVANPGFTYAIHSDVWGGNGLAPDVEYTGAAPKERIEYIFYRGSLRPTKSYTYARNAKMGGLRTKEWSNPWPSAHWAVITEFEHTPYKHENKPSFFVGTEYLKGSQSYPAQKKCPILIK